MEKSILKPILLQLKFLKFFGGFPLKIQFVEEGTQFNFECLQGIKLVFLFCHFQYLFCLDIDLRCFCGFNGRFGRQKIMKPNIILIEVQ